MHRFRSWLPLVGWLASLAAGIVLFTALGSGPLEAPPLGTPSAWGDWATERDPVVAAVAVLRLLVLALSWYLVAVTTVGLVARLTRAARLVRVADALSVPVVRNVLQSAIGLTLAASVVAASSGPLPAAGRDGTPSASVTATAVALSDAPDASSLATDPADDVGASARMVRVERSTAAMRAVDGPTARMVGLGPPGAQDTQTDDASPAEEATSAEHEVVAGEHLWGIAEAHLADGLGRAPSEAEVVAHWQRLIDDNRERLANPDDPDLIFPGQRLVLPALPDVAAGDGA